MEKTKVLQIAAQLTGRLSSSHDVLDESREPLAQLLGGETVDELLAVISESQQLLAAIPDLLGAAEEATPVDGSPSTVTARVSTSGGEEELYGCGHA